MNVAYQSIYLAPVTRDRQFVFKHHRAQTLHYDFRIRCYGILLSWMFDRLPNLRPGDRTPAIVRNDHDPRYMLSERRIPEGKIGAGPMVVSDFGPYFLTGLGKRTTDADVQLAHERGRIDLTLCGNKLDGDFRLVRLSEESWYLETLRLESAVSAETWNDVSVISGRTIQDIESDYQAKKWLEMQKRYPELGQQGLF